MLSSECIRDDAAEKLSESLRRGLRKCETNLSVMAQCGPLLGELQPFIHLSHSGDYDNNMISLFYLFFTACGGSVRIRDVGITDSESMSRDITGENKFAQ